MLKFAIFEVYLLKIAKKPLFTIISAIYFRGRPLRKIYLLLQFFSELDNSFCKILRKGWATIPSTRILNFYRKTKWRRLKVCIRKKGVNSKIKLPPFCFAIKIKNSDRGISSHTFPEYFAKGILQF